MKKSITLVLMMLFLSSLFLGCSQKQKTPNPDVNTGADEKSIADAFALYNVSEEEDTAGENSSVENSPLWTLKKSTAQGNNAPQSITVTFDGKSYTGEYWYSAVMRHTPYTSHYYLFSEGWFSVKSTTAEVDCILFALPSQTSGNKSAEECKATAVTLASQYINVDDYKLTIETTENLHAYSFERYVEDMRTEAYLSVGIDKDGKVVSFSFGSTKELDAALAKMDKEGLKERLALYTSDEVVSAIRKEQIELSEKDAQIKLSDPCMVVLENGDIGVMYDVTVDVVEQKEDGEMHMEKHAKYLVGPRVSE